MHSNHIQLYGAGDFPIEDYLVLLDIPSEASILEEVMKNSQPDRVYAHFYVPESKYFDGLPGREQFGWYYSFLKNRGSFDMAKTESN